MHKLAISGTVSDRHEAAQILRIIADHVESVNTCVGGTLNIDNFNRQIKWEIQRVEDV